MLILILLRGGKFSAQGFISKDEIKNPSQFSEDYLLKNNVFGFKWFQVGDVPLFFELGISVSNFTGEIVPKFSGLKSRKNDLTDVGLEMDFNYIFDSKDEISLGLHIHDIQAKLLLENSIGSISDIGNKGTNISFYAKYKFLRHENLGIDIGNRFNLTRLTGSESTKYMFEPRLSITYRIHPLIALKGAVGIYQQELTTLSDDNELMSVFEPWLITPAYIEPSRSVHYIIGIDYDVMDNLYFGIESYYKYVNSLPILNNKKIYPSDHDFIAGEGESYGTEIQAKYLTDFISITISYTRSWAYKLMDGQRYYPKYDQRNSGNILLDFNLERDGNLVLFGFTIQVYLSLKELDLLIIIVLATIILIGYPAII